MGVREEDQPRLLQLFGKLECEEYRSLNNRGIGLGLMISNQLVHCLGASGIKFESTFGVGSDFYFELPLISYSQGEDTDDRSPTRFDLLEESPTQKYRRKAQIPRQTLIDSGCQCRLVLIVDDNDYNLMVLRRKLEKRNIPVLEAYDGAEALEKLQDAQQKHPACNMIPCRRVNLIFSDLNMPVKDGFELISDLRRLNYPLKNIPIVLVSAFDKPDDVATGFKLGMNDVLFKPVKEERLDTILKKYQLM
eukprot:TRINITY_DN5806_c0_g1_i2.p1 TRINITY_DN5806_c0_g1~~TRINITY_DN5806_c0_g1_i2.p1  ORF type:complete len:249 (-),score=56.72 TRINITY_DN5806_c0_g1_i2:5-751(-)